jgi:hypothetical protein
MLRRGDFQMENHIMCVCPFWYEKVMSCHISTRETHDQNRNGVKLASSSCRLGKLRKRTRSLTFSTNDIISRYYESLY